MSFTYQNTYAQDGNKDSSSVFKQFSAENLRGTKFSRYGHIKEGIASTMDQSTIKREIDKEIENWGNGFVKFQIVNPDGSPARDKPINIGGRMHFPGADGFITIVDDDFLKKQVEIENEKRSYLESLIEKASVSDGICSLMLGIKDLDSVLGAGNRGTVPMHKDLTDVDARPSALETYDPTSIVYSRAVQKFKLVMKAYMPIVSSLTPASAQNAGMD